MNKYALRIIAWVAVVASVIMYSAGSSNPNLTELNDVWWLPLPVAAICYLLSMLIKTKSK